MAARGVPVFRGVRRLPFVQAVGLLRRRDHDRRWQHLRLDVECGAACEDRAGAVLDRDVDVGLRTLLLHRLRANQNILTGTNRLHVVDLQDGERREEDEAKKQE